MIAARPPDAACVLLLAAAALLAPGLFRPAFARQTPPSAAGPSDPAKSLEAALPRVAWGAERGVLLVVDAAGARPEKDAAPLDPPSARGYGLARVAAYFGRRAFVAGDGLTVLAPARMTVLHTRLPKPDLTAGLSRDRRALLFFASLERAQWQALGSPSGIGLSDLTSEQRPLFLGLLPREPRVLRVVRKKGWFEPIPGTAPEPVRPEAIRLRLNRTVDLILSPAEPGGVGMQVRSLFPEVAEGETFQVMARDGFYEPPKSQFGATLREEVPSRLKPSDLDCDAAALRAPVPLEPPESGALTVGELVARAATATGLELRADRRVAALPVTLRRPGAATLPAGALLRGLAAGICGAFRRIGPVFLLTDDREGIGARARGSSRGPTPPSGRGASGSRSFTNASPPPRPTRDSPSGRATRSPSPRQTGGARRWPPATPARLASRPGCGPSRSPNCRPRPAPS